MCFGAKIKQLREENQMTQGDLARKARLTENLASDRSYISSVESGKIKKVGAATIVKFAAAFGISEDILFEAAGLKTRPRSKGAAEEKEEFLKFLKRIESLTPRAKKFIEDAMEMAFEANDNFKE